MSLFYNPFSKILQLGTGIKYKESYNPEYGVPASVGDIWLNVETGEVFVNVGEDHWLGSEGSVICRKVDIFGDMSRIMYCPFNGSLEDRCKLIKFLNHDVGFSTGREGDGTKALDLVDREGYLYSINKLPSMIYRTVSLWVYLERTASDWPKIILLSSLGLDSFGVGRNLVLCKITNSNKLEIGASDGYASKISKYPTQLGLSVGNWVFILLEFTIKDYKLYINNQLSDTIYPSAHRAFNITPTYVILGDTGTGMQNVIKLQQLSVFNRLLSAEEKDLLMNESVFDEY